MESRSCGLVCALWCTALPGAGGGTLCQTPRDSKAAPAAPLAVLSWAWMLVDCACFPASRTTGLHLQAGDCAPVSDGHSECITPAPAACV